MIDCFRRFPETSEDVPKNSEVNPSRLSTWLSCLKIGEPTIQSVIYTSIHGLFFSQIGRTKFPFFVVNEPFKAH